MPTSAYLNYPSGNVVGPLSSTDSGFAQYDGATGQLIKNHAATVAVATEVSGLGSNVATALGVAIGSAGAPVVLGGALGTPISGTLTNATGLPVASVTGLGTGVATLLAAAPSGTGGLVGTNTPTLVTPVLGAATGTSVNLSGNIRGASFNVGATAGVDASIVIPAVATITVSKGLIVGVA